MVALIARKLWRTVTPVNVLKVADEKTVDRNVGGNGGWLNEKQSTGLLPLTSGGDRERSQDSREFACFIAHGQRRKFGIEFDREAAPLLRTLCGCQLGGHHSPGRVPMLIRTSHTRTGTDGDVQHGGIRGRGHRLALQHSSELSAQMQGD